MASSYLQKFPVPENFPEILADLTKSILKEQPSDIIEFSYHYFKAKVEGKDEPIAERKNYYGNQIKKQKRNGKADVIERPPRGHSSQSEYRPKTETSNKTKKVAANQFVDDLTEQALDMYENNVTDDGRPKTSGRRLHTGQSNPRSEPTGTRTQHIPPEHPEQERPLSRDSQRYRRIFDQIDVNKSGFVSLGELEKYLTSIGHDMSDEQVQRFFAIIDGDGSKLIEFHEFLPFMKSIMGDLGTNSNLTEDEKNKILFNHVDINKSGFISKEELGAGLRRIGFNLLDDDVLAIFAAIDSDESGLIKFQEFNSFMKKFTGGIQVAEELEAREVAEAERKRRQNEGNAQPLPMATGPQVDLQIEEMEEGGAEEDYNGGNMPKGAGDTMYRQNLLKELVRRSFDFYDFDRSGFLDKNEIRRLVDDVSKELRIPKVPQEKLDKFISKSDQNKDGKFDFNEYTQFATPIFDELLKEKINTSDQAAPRSRPMSKGELESQIKGAINDLFVRYDIDKSNFLERNEIIFLLNDLADFLGHPRIPIEAIDGLIQRFDQTQNGKWNPQELFNFAYPYFSKLVRERENGERTQIHPPQNIPQPFVLDENKLKEIVERNFRFFDKDGSGFLEPKEFIELMHAINKELKIPPMDEKQIIEFVEVFDENSDKKLDLKEAMEFMLPAAIAIEKKRAEEIANMRQNMVNNGYQMPPPPVISDEQLKTVINNYFNNFDKDKTGFLEKGEIKKMVDAVFFKLQIPAMSDQDIEGFIKSFDQDGDKKFSREEAFNFLRPAVVGIATMEANKNNQQGPPPNTNYPPENQIMSEQALRDAIELNFLHFDSDNSGYLEPTEIKKLVEAIAKELKFDKPLDEQVDQFITTFDQDGDKKFDRAEAFSFLRPIVLQMEAKAQEEAYRVSEDALNRAIMENFVNFDKDNTGFLESNEIVNLVKAVALQLDFDQPMDKEIDDLITIFDKDGDRKFDINEAYGFLRPIVMAIDQQAMENGGIMTNKELRDIITLNFNHFDKDKTGTLSYTEIKDFLLAVSKELKINPDIPIDQRVNLLLNTYDQDGDRKFGIEEAFHFLRPLVLSLELQKQQLDAGEEDEADQLEQKLREAVALVFKEMDVDNSGFLEKDEVKPMLQKIMDKYKFKKNINSLLYQFMKEFDTDGDRKFNIDEAYTFLKPLILSMHSDNEKDKVKYDDLVEAFASWSANPADESNLSPLVPKPMVNLMIITILKNVEYKPTEMDNYIMKQFHKDIPRKAETVAVNVVFNFLRQMLCPGELTREEVEEIPNEMDDKTTGISVPQSVYLSSFLYQYIHLDKDREDKSTLKADLVSPLSILVASSLGYVFLERDSKDIEAFVQAHTTEGVCSYEDIYVLFRSVFCTLKAEKAGEAYNFETLKTKNDEESAARAPTVKKEEAFNKAYEEAKGEVFGEELAHAKVRDFINTVSSKLSFSPSSDDLLFIELIVNNAYLYENGLISDEDAFKFDLRHIYIGNRSFKADAWYNRTNKIRTDSSLSNDLKGEEDPRKNDDKPFTYSQDMPKHYMEKKFDNGLSLDLYTMTTFHAKNHGLGDTGSKNMMKKEAMYKIIRDMGQRQLRVLDIDSFVLCWKKYLENEKRISVKDGNVNGSVCFLYLRPAFYNLYCMNQQFVKQGEEFCKPDYEKVEFKEKLDAIAKEYEFDEKDAMDLDDAMKFIQEAFDKLYKGKIFETQTKDVYKTIQMSLPKEPGNRVKRGFLYKTLLKLIGGYYYEKHFNGKY